MWPDSLRARLHHTGNSRFVTFVPGFTLDDAKHDIPVVDDDGKIIVRTPATFDVPETFPHGTRENIPLDDLPNPAMVCIRSFGLPTRCKPICLATPVSVNFLES